MQTELALKTMTRRGSIATGRAPEAQPLVSAEEAKDYSGQLRLRIPQSLHRQLALAADQEGVSLNTLLVHLLSGNQRELHLIRSQVIVQNSRQLHVKVVARETKYVSANNQGVEFFGAPSLFELL